MASRPFVHDEHRDEVLSPTAEETSRIRYTAATCDPDDFTRSGYSLRHYGRDTELFIAVTMCDEDVVLFSRTMDSIVRNVAHLCSRDGSRTWDKYGWKKVVVCIIADGRKEVNEQILQLLSQIGCYKEGIAQKTVNGEAVTAHIFENTLSFDTDAGETPVDVLFPIRIIFCLKEQSNKKLNSHRWFFNALCPLVNPKVCILLDVGIKPTCTSIYELWRCFDKHPHVGGACGEIVPAGLLASALAAVQNFGQGVSNIFHKPVEINAFDCVSFLPGAFSAYRYEAMLDSSHGPAPLSIYLRGEDLPGGTARGGPSERSMQPTEDQILLLEIVMKKWALRHVKSAKASVFKETT